MHILKSVNSTFNWIVYTLQHDCSHLVYEVKQVKYQIYILQMGNFYVGYHLTATDCTVCAHSAFIM